MYGSALQDTLHEGIYMAACSPHLRICRSASAWGVEGRRFFDACDDQVLTSFVKCIRVLRSSLVANLMGSYILP